MACFSIILVSLLATVTVADAEDAEQFAAKLERFCVDKWPDDSGRRESCVREEREAAAQVQEYVRRYNVVPNMAKAKELAKRDMTLFDEFAAKHPHVAVFALCWERYGDEYSMLDYCLQREGRSLDAAESVSTTP